MRLPRVQIKGESAVYHCMSRIVGGDYLLGDLEKETLLKQILKLSEFCGIELLSYCIMSNHYHLLIRVPKQIRLTDSELLEKVRVYYGEESTRYVNFKQKQAVEDESAIDMKSRLLAMMGCMPTFQKLLKQRFSIWYNRRTHRRGTLWMERYKSLIVEDTLHARLTLSAYINLNPVRAGIVRDPAEYRFSDYGRAMGGDKRARFSFELLTGEQSWAAVQKAYRPFILARGLLDTKGNNRTVKESLLEEAEALNGRLPLPNLLRLRVRYFSDGLVLGGEEFVENIYHQYREYFGKSRRKGSRKMSGGDWGNLTVIRDLRNNVFE